MPVRSLHPVPSRPFPEPPSEAQKLTLALTHTEKGDEVAKAINDAHPNRAIAVPGDVTDPSYFPKLVKAAAEFGNGKIHIIVNNAGYTWDGVIHKVNQPRWFRIEHIWGWSSLGKVFFADGACASQTTDKQWDTIIALHNTAPFKLDNPAGPFF